MSVAVLLISMGVIILSLNGLLMKGKRSWTPVWRLNLSRKQWAVSVVGGAVSLAGVILAIATCLK